MIIKKFHCVWIQLEDRLFFSFKNEKESFDFWLTRLMTQKLLSKLNEVIDRSYQEKHATHLANDFKEFNKEYNQQKINRGENIVSKENLEESKNRLVVGFRILKNKNKISLDLNFQSNKNLNITLNPENIQAISVLINDTQMKANWGIADDIENKNNIKKIINMIH